MCDDSADPRPRGVTGQPSMDEREYRLMAEVETEHWWYRGLQDLIARVLRSRQLVGRSGLRVLDAGCGTGENLRLLGELLPDAELGGFDISPLAVELARAKAPRADVYPSDLCNPSLHGDAYDLILSCDVLCTTGWEAARDGLVRLAGALRQDGLLILHLPAYQWLFSAHDLAVGTRERFTAGRLAVLIEGLGLEVDLLTYRMSLLFPAVVLARLPSLLRRPRSVEAVHSDLSRPHPLVNRGLTRILKFENAAIIRGIRWPWGVSVFAVARRAATGPRPDGRSPSGR